MYKNQPLVMLPTNKAEGALIINGKMQNYRADSLYTQEYLKSCNAKSYHLYILSDDEIKADDWVLINNLHIRKCEQLEPSKPELIVVSTNNGILRNHCKKIIATTNTSIKVKSNKNLLKEYITIDENLNGVSLPQIPTSFIQYFIEHYNKGNIITKVNVEYEADMSNTPYTSNKHNNALKALKESANVGCKLKINSDNTINIKIIKDSYTHTLKELNNILTKYAAYINNDADIDESEILTVDKWIEQNL